MATQRGIVIKIEGDGESARRALEMVREQMRETAESSKEDASQMAEAWERVKGAVESVGLYLGVREAIDGVKELIGGSLELGEAMVQAHQKTGLQVETLSTLHYASGILGADFEGLVGGIGKMNRTIGEAADGNKQAGKFMQALGLNAKDLAGRTDGTEIAFHKFVQTLAATENPIRRSELAMGLLGRAGSAQIPVLVEIAEHWDEFRAKAQAAGVMLDGQTAQSLADTSQRMHDLEQRIQGAGLALTEGMAPGLSQIFSIISGGKGQLEQMNLMGQNLSKTFAFVGEIFYSAAAAAEVLFATSEGGRFTEAGRRDEAAFEELRSKAQAMHDLAFSKGTPQQTPLISGLGSGGPGAGFEGAGDGKGGATKAGRSDNPIAAERAALAAEQAKAAADAIKAFDQQRLAELDADHKMQIVADQQFYAEKLALQLESIGAEENALRARQTALQSLDQQQKGDKLAHRDKHGDSAEELRTQRELVQVQEQLTQLAARRGELSSANTAEISGSNKAADLANLRAAAALEKQRNDGIAAQIALIRAERNEEAQKLSAEGGSDVAAAQVRTLGEVQVKQLQINEIGKQITDTENNTKRAIEELNDAAAKDPRLKNQTVKEINQLNKAEAQQLTQLVDAYEALAKELGGDYLQKSKDLHAELDKLNTPDVKDQAQFSKMLTQGIDSIGERMTRQAVMGKTSFHDMAKSVEADLAELALKAAFLKLSQSGSDDGDDGDGGGGGILSSIMGALGEHHMSGGQTSGGWAVVGESGPELAKLPRGTSVTPNNMISKLAETSSGGKAPNVTTNVINQSSQPVQAQPSQVDWHSEMQQYVITTILNDHASNGPIAQSMQGMSGNR